MSTENKTPPYGCQMAADYFVDFEMMDGVSNVFKASLEDMPSEHDAMLAVARHIDKASGYSELLNACRIALQVCQFDAGVGRKAYDLQFVQDTLNAAIARATGDQS